MGLRLLAAADRAVDLEPEREELARDDLGSDEPLALPDLLPLEPPVLAPLLLERDVGVPVAIF